LSTVTLLSWTAVAGAQINYCTAKVNSLGCTPAIVWSGTSSATQPAGFSITATNAISHKPGLFIYTSNGRAAMPFEGGTLCINTPIKRGIPLSSFGTFPPNTCTGSFQMDMNTYTQGGYYPLPPPNPPFANLPAAYLMIPSTVIDIQAWGRDPGYPMPFNTYLSDGLEFTIGP
jgi:hypothetical protein